MSIKQILNIVFFLVSVFKSSEADCNPYSFFGESKVCEVPEERGDELFARPKPYRISDLQLLIIFLILFIIFYSIRKFLQYEPKKEEEQNKEILCNCPITQTSPDITATEKLSWESTSTCEVPESENSKGLITVSLIKGYNNLRLFQIKGCSKIKEGLKRELTYETIVCLAQKVVLQDRRPPAERTIFTVGWAAVLRNTSIELENQDNEGVGIAEVANNTAEGEREEVSIEEGKRNNNEGEEDVQEGNLDGEGNDVKSEVNKEETEKDEEDHWEEIEDCEKCVNGTIIFESRGMLTEAEENELLVKELMDRMVRQMLDSSTGGVPVTMEEKVYMEDLLETKLALEEEWEHLENTRSNNWQDRMRRADEYLKALRSQVQQLSDFSKEHGDLCSLNSPNGRCSRSAENVSRTEYEPPCTRIHRIPPMIQPLKNSNLAQQGPRRMPSPPARAAGFPRDQEEKQSFPIHSQNQRMSVPFTRAVSGPQTLVDRWCSMEGRASRREVHQRTQESGQGTSRGSTQYYPTSVSVSIGGTRRRCICENTSSKETNLLCSVCRRKHLS